MPRTGGFKVATLWTHVDQNKPKRMLTLQEPKTLGKERRVTVKREKKKKLTIIGKLNKVFKSLMWQWVEKEVEWKF